MNGVVREVNASIMGSCLELLGAHGRSPYAEDDTVLVADSEKLCRLISMFDSVRGGSCELT
jgi:hypothetical protein